MSAGVRGRPRGAGAAAMPGSSAGRSATGCSARDAPTSTSSSPATRARPPAASPRAPGGLHASPCPRSSAPGGSSRAIGSWQVDVEPLRGGDARGRPARCATSPSTRSPSRSRAARRSIRSAALADLRARRLRSAGPGAFAQDPLRVLRLVRVAVRAGPASRRRTTLRAAREQAAAPARRVGRARLHRAAPDRRRRRGARRAWSCSASSGRTTVVLPELEALRGVEQNRFHHRDVYGHTLEVLDRTVELTRGRRARAGERRAALGHAAERGRGAAGRAAGRRDDPRRGAALGRAAARRGQAADPRGAPADGRVTFIGHDVAAPSSRGRCSSGCARASACARHVAALVRHHLRLGFLVHEPQPLARRTCLRLPARMRPGRGRRHAAVGRRPPGDARRRAAARRSTRISRWRGGLLDDALRWRAEGPPQPLLRGDELAAELGIEPGPRVGELLGELLAAQYAGELGTREQAIAHARAAASSTSRPRRARHRICRVADPDCIFCKIVAGELPAHDRRRGRAHDRLHGHRAGDARARAGDPARARADLLSVERGGSAGGGAGRPAPGAARAKERLGADGVNLHQLLRRAAWQTVFHFHVHVIPRYEGDPLRLPWVPSPGDPDGDRGRRAGTRAASSEIVQPLHLAVGRVEWHT